MLQTKLTTDERDSLIQAARQAMQNAYAPYSGFFVGAAILTDKGEVFTGCNVENASYGLTNCAERTAIFSAVAKLGAKNLAIRAVAVVNKADVPCSPCGGCRQVLGEFAVQATVIFRVQDGYKEMSVAELLPHGFKLS